MLFPLVVEGDVQTAKYCRVWPYTVVTKVHVLCTCVTYSVHALCTRTLSASADNNTGNEIPPLLGRRKVCCPLKLAVCGRAHITSLSVSFNSDVHELYTLYNGRSVANSCTRSRDYCEHPTILSDEYTIRQ